MRYVKKCLISVCRYLRRKWRWRPRFLNTIKFRHHWTLTLFRQVFIPEQLILCCTNGLHKRNSGSALFLLLTILSISRFLLEVDIVVLPWIPWVVPRPRPEWTSGVRPSFERWNPSVWWQAELMQSSIAHSLAIRLKKSHGSEKVGGFSKCFS